MAAEAVGVQGEVTSFRLEKWQNKKKDKHPFQIITWEKGEPIIVTDHDRMTGEVVDRREFPEGFNLGDIL